MSKQRLLLVAATAMTLSACGMFDGMGSNRSGSTGAPGDGGNTGTGSEAVAACKGLTGDALRVDAPQYGVSTTNGSMRARVTADGIVIDAARFEGGAGVFTAQGVIALPGARTSAPTRVTWVA